MPSIVEQAFSAFTFGSIAANNFQTINMNVVISNRGVRMGLGDTQNIKFADLLKYSQFIYFVPHATDVERGNPMIFRGST